MTTPKTKLMAKMRPQKRAARSHCSLPVLQRHRLEHHDQQRQAHGELRKQIVEGDGEGEVQAVDQLGGHSGPPVSKTCPRMQIGDRTKWEVRDESDYRPQSETESQQIAIRAIVGFM